MEVVLFVDVPEQTLAYWLEGHTAHVARRVFQTDEGELRLYALRGLMLPSSLFGPIGMRGVITPTRPRQKKLELPNLVRVSLIPLGPRRTELRIATDWPALEEYVAETVTAIRQRWNVSSPDAPNVVAAPSSSVRPTCAHPGDGICTSCSEFLGRVVPLLTIGDRKPTQEDVARSLGYTTRHVRRLCEGLGFSSWPAFYSAVLAGKLSPMS